MVVMRGGIQIKDDDTQLTSVSPRVANNTSWSALEFPLVLITIHTKSDKIKAEISALENTNMKLFYLRNKKISIRHILQHHHKNIYL